MVVAQHNDDFVGFYPDCVMITTKIEGKIKTKIGQFPFSKNECFIYVPAKYSPTLDEILLPIKEKIKSLLIDTFSYNPVNLTPDQTTELDNYKNLLNDFILSITSIDQAVGEIIYPTKPSFMV